MRIECPCCGTRDHAEFSFLGDASPRRPQGMEAEAAAMHDYVYLRDNPAGHLQELWYHASGCRSWLVVTRNVRTHDISEVVFASAVAPVPSPAKGSPEGTPVRTDGLWREKVAGGA